MSDDGLDISIQNEGSLLILWAVTHAGKTWLQEHLPEDAPRWGTTGYVVEPRYVDPIIDGAGRDGLAVA
jgi:hypothetical protein